MSSSHEQSQGGEQSVKSEVPPVVQAATSSCRKKKSDSESTLFFSDIVDHIDEFVHASMDEHKSCLQQTLTKMVGMSKAVASGAGTTNSSAPVESVMSRRSNVSF